MKRLFAMGVLALGAVAFAQDKVDTTTYRCAPDLCVDGYGQAYDFGSKNDPAKATEYLAVLIPQRVGIHLHENYWGVDLTDLSKNSCQCYRAGNHSTETGRDTLYDIAAVFAGATFRGDGKAQAGDPYSFVGLLNWNDTRVQKVSRYPGFEFNDKTNALLWKGPIMCVNQKIVEKFSNAPKGWTFTASLSSSAGFPSFIVADQVAGDGKKVAWLRQAGVNKGEQTLASGSGATMGWLDDYLLEAMVFDGYEQPGIQTGAVTFKVTGNF